MKPFSNRALLLASLALLPLGIAFITSPSPPQAQESQASPHSKVSSFTPSAISTATDRNKLSSLIPTAISTVTDRNRFSSLTPTAISAVTDRNKLSSLTPTASGAVTDEKTMPSGSWNALVTGGTGAIGRYLVAELLSNDKFSKVTVIGRREITFPTEKQPSEEQLSKLSYKLVTDLDEIASLEPSQLTPSEYEVAFCALGTTIKDAGSAAAFRKIDYDGAVNFGNLAKAANVEHLQLVSSKAANKNSYFLYIKTKGETEAYYQSLGVKQVTIFRPPLLDRGDSARFLEKAFKFVMASVKVGDVAKAMVRHAETVLQSGKKGEEIFETKDIIKLGEDS